MPECPDDAGEQPCRAAGAEEVSAFGSEAVNRERTAAQRQYRLGVPHCDDQSARVSVQSVGVLTAVRLGWCEPRLVRPRHRAAPAHLKPVFRSGDLGVEAIQLGAVTVRPAGTASRLDPPATLREADTARCRQGAVPGAREV